MFVFFAYYLPTFSCCLNFLFSMYLVFVDSRLVAINVFSLSIITFNYMVLYVVAFALVLTCLVSNSFITLNYYLN